MITNSAGLQSQMKDHQIARLVNNLVIVANKYHGHQYLRQAISHTVNGAIKMSEDQKPMDQNKQAVDITGYRVMNEDEKFLINLLKKNEQLILEHLTNMQGPPGDDGIEINQRSLSIAITNIQTGFMWAIRAIARPNGD